MNPPGPIPTQIRGTSAQPTSACASACSSSDCRARRGGAARRAWGRRGARPRARRERAPRPTSRSRRCRFRRHASHASIQSCGCRRPRARAGRVRDALGREGVRGVLGPLHEHDRVVAEVGVEQARILDFHPGEPIRSRWASGPLAPSWRWPTTNVGRSEGPPRPGAQRAAHERRLPGAELAGDEHDVAGLQPGGEFGAGGSVASGPGQLVRSRRRARSVRPAPSRSAPPRASGQASMPVYGAWARGRGVAAAAGLAGAGVAAGWAGAGAGVGGGRARRGRWRRRRSSPTERVRVLVVAGALGKGAAGAGRATAAATASPCRSRGPAA